MYYTPGWGALMIVTGTLGGVALTQLNQHRIIAKQAAEQHRIEQRQAVLSVIEAGTDVVKAGKAFLSEVSDTASDSTYPLLPRPEFDEAGRQMLNSINGYRTAGINALLVLTNKKILTDVNRVQGNVEQLEQSVCAIKNVLGSEDKAEVQRQTAHAIVTVALPRELSALTTTTAKELKP